jgi:hypothetical protein
MRLEENIMSEQNELSQKDVLLIYSRYKRVRNDCTWKCWDDFLQWAVSNGWGKGLEMRKHNEAKPHGPTNSYFYSLKEEVQQKHEKVLADRAIVSRFCQGCEKKCPADGRGCPEWVEYYLKNWNENIHVPAKGSEHKGRMKFRYEHPDLIREGITYG